MIYPIKIRNVQLANNLILAPMAGVTDGPFRKLCAELGAGLTISELASAKGIVKEGKQTLEVIGYNEQPRPYTVQLFGADPETMAEAARIVESLSICDIIDINMGCPVSKVVKTGAGAALMKDINLASKILAAVKNAVKLPVTVKCRIGWNKNSINIREFVRMLVDSGADAITVHARTREDGYAGKARWEYLESLQSLAGSVPLFANGDLTSIDDLKKVHEISGCSGFMIGRGAIGSPWIFGVLSGSLERPPTETEKFAFFKRHFIDSLIEHGSKGVSLFRVHLFAYLRCHPFAARIRREMCTERDPAKVLETAEKFFSDSTT